MPIEDTKKVAADLMLYFKEKDINPGVASSAMILAVASILATTAKDEKDLATGVALSTLSLEVSSFMAFESKQKKEKAEYKEPEVKIDPTIFKM